MQGVAYVICGRMSVMYVLYAHGSACMTGRAHVRRQIYLAGVGTDSARPPAGCIVFERTTNFLEPKTDQDKIGFGASVLTFGCDSSQASVAQVCVLEVARGRCVFICIARLHCAYSTMYPGSYMLAIDSWSAM